MASGAALADDHSPVEREDPGLAFFSIEDVEAGLVMVTGPPLEQGCFGQGFEPALRTQGVTLPDGTILGVATGQQDTWVYEGSSIGELCFELAVNGISPTLVASGTGRVAATDNDLNVTSGRTNTFGVTVTGRLATPDGERCNLRAHNRAQITEDGFVPIVNDIRVGC